MEGVTIKWHEQIWGNNEMFLYLDCCEEHLTYKIKTKL